MGKILAAADGSLDPQVAIGYLLGLNYLHTLPDIAKQGDRVFLPFEATSILGAVGESRICLRPKRWTLRGGIGELGAESVSQWRANLFLDAEAFVEIRDKKSRS